MYCPFAVKTVCGIGMFKPKIKNPTIQTKSKYCKWYSACPMKRFYEEGKLGKEWIELYCKGDWESCIRYEMEEKGEYHPDYMLPDGSIDKEL